MVLPVKQREISFTVFPWPTQHGNVRGYVDVCIDKKRNDLDYMEK